jgi:hypothetical protein
LKLRFSMAASAKYTRAGRAMQFVVIKDG